MNDEISSGFMVIQSNLVENLRDLLTTWTTKTPLTPLEDEIILVQSNGIAQWLRLALANHTSSKIAAGIQTPLPSAFVWQMYRTVLPNLPKISAYDKNPLAWRIFTLLQDENRLLQEMGEQAKDLLLFLRRIKRQLQLWQFAYTVADTFDQYQVYRADWLNDWNKGKEELRGFNGLNKKAVPPSQRWQVGLWRLLTKDISEQSGRSFIHRRFLETINSLQQRPTTIPRRISVFGITSLPTQILEVLQALSKFSQVLFFVHNPCRHYWGDIIENREMFLNSYRRTKKRKIPDNCDENSLHIYGNPLLAAWGKQGRDYIRLLDEIDQTENYRPELATHNFSVDVFENFGNDSLLHCLQDDILELRSKDEIQRENRRITADGSIQFHIAHCPQREVEILHDRLVALFAAAQERNEPLNPADILVMMPDIAVYAPHIDAVFGSFRPNEAGFLPYRLNDRPSVQTSLLQNAFSTLLSLPTARFQAEDVLDFLNIPALQAKFSIHKNDLPVLRIWIQSCNINWGLNKKHKLRLGLPEDDRNSWQFGLERMLLGFALGDAPAWKEVEPYAAVSGLQAELAGRLAQCIQTLQKYYEILTKKHTPEKWCEILLQMLADFFEPTDKYDRRILQTVQNALENWTDECELGGFVAPLTIETVKSVLEEKINSQSGLQNFFPGAINFATLRPMRTIPFKHIWLLGMDDTNYPRKNIPPAIDLMTEMPRPGDRSRRDDDHYLFLEALLSARKSLSISWVGKNITDNSNIPPSIVVSQLQDQINSLSEENFTAQITTQYPVKSYSRRYFSSENELFTYAEKWRNVHLVHEKHKTRQVLIQKNDPETIGIYELTAFLKNPAQIFYANRLAVHKTYEQPLISPQECFELENLDRYLIVKDLIDTVFQQAKNKNDFEKLGKKRLNRLARSGDFAVANWGILQQEKILHSTSELFEQMQEFCLPLTENCNFSISNDTTLFSGSLVLQKSENDDRRQIFVLAGDGKKKKHYIQPWICHLAANSQIPTETVIIWQGGTLTLPARNDNDLTEKTIHELLKLRNEGMLFPLPVNLEMGIKYLTAKEDKREKTLQTLADIYDNFKNQDGKTEFLRPCYPFFADLQTANFTDWATRLYAKFVEETERKK